MTDLTDLKTPFGLLDDATREALKAHGGPYEFLNDSCVWMDTLRSPSWFPRDIYRVKPQPPKPREVWMRVNQNGDWRDCPEDAEGVRLFREVLD